MQRLMDEKAHTSIVVAIQRQEAPYVVRPVGTQKVNALANAIATSLLECRFS
jgi:hypothetical protein